MSNLTVFQFESQEVRFVGTADDPWWVIADVCTVLEIKNVGNVIAKLDDDDKRDDIQIMDVIGRNQSVWCVNESGLYSLIFVSRKPQAKRFKKWVTSEVLPSIRKTGSYIVPSVVRETAIATPPELPSLEQRASFLLDFSLKALSYSSKMSPDLQSFYALKAVEAGLPEITPTIKVLTGAIQETTATSDRHVTPTILGELYQQRNGLPKPIKATDINIALFNAGLQRKEILVKVDKNSGKERSVNKWHLTEAGKEWGIVVKDKARGHDKTVEHVRWLPTVLEVIYLEGVA